MTTTPTPAARVSGTIKALEWQPIETAPKDGTNIILYCAHDVWEVIEIGSFRNDDNDQEGDEPCWLDNSYDDFSYGYASCPLDPTHWMPLPEPPDNVGKGHLKATTPTQPDPEPQPVAWQFRAMENGQPRTGWHMAGTNDHAVWVELARRDATCSIEDRPLFAIPLFASPSSAGTVSVEAAAKVIVDAWDADTLPVNEPAPMLPAFIAALRALAGEADE